MTDEPEEKSDQVLAEQRLGQRGLHVKLDRGFEDGTYSIYIEFDDLSSRVGFGPAHRQAVECCRLLKTELGRFSGHHLAETEDASRTGDPRRKRDLELTYLTFAVLTADGRFHDEAMKEAFRVALARTGQQWDQAQARADTQRHDSRRDAFRQRFRTLLASDGYSHVDKTTKERLLHEVPALAFPSRGRRL